MTISALRYENFFVGKRWQVLLFIWSLAMALTGCRSSLPECTDALGCIFLRPNESVQIGYMLALSGEAAFIGEDQLRGLELAIADRGGTFLGHGLQLAGIDTECRHTAARPSLEELLANENVVAVIGPTCSDEVSEAIPLIESAGLTLISPSATATDLFAQLPAGTASDSFFRLAPDNRRQAAVAAQFAYTMLGARTATTIVDGSNYAQALQQQFVNTFEQLGGQIFAQGIVSVGQTVIDDVLTGVFAAETDVLFAPVFAPEASLLVNELRETDDTNTSAFIGPDTLLLPDFPVSSGSLASGIYLTGTAVTGPRYDEFVTRWTERYGAPPAGPFHAHAYDAANLLLDTLAQVAQSDANGALQIGRQALRSAIANTSNYDGITGTLTCQNGECASGTAIGVYEITDRQVDGTNWPPPVIWTPPPNE